MTHHQTHKNCPNCDSHLINHYCAQCGQPTIHEFKNTWEEIKYFFHSFLHFLQTFLKTFLAMFKPGFLANEYSLGKRASYTPPFQFTIIIISFFALLSYFTQFKFFEFRNLADINGYKIQYSARFEKVENCFIDEETKNKEINYIKNWKLDPNNRSNIKNREILLENSKMLFLKNLESKKANTFNNTCYVQDSFISWATTLIYLLIPFFALILKLFFKKHLKSLSELLSFCCHATAVFYFWLICFTLYRLLSNQNFVPYYITDFIFLTLLMINQFLSFKSYFKEKSLIIALKFISLLLINVIIVVTLSLLFSMVNIFGISDGFTQFIELLN